FISSGVDRIFCLEISGFGVTDFTGGLDGGGCISSAETGLFANNFQMVAAHPLCMSDTAALMAITKPRLRRVTTTPSVAISA
ncbi:MAG: hypothetical protein UY05_C0036G0001, partial [Candidatus Peregrinibacteria bacterium GW2011_GWA2_47_7]